MKNVLALRNRGSGSAGNLLLVAVVLLSASSLVVAQDYPCTPGTCIGPTRQVWNNDDCSGLPASTKAFNLNISQCQSYSDSSLTVTCGSSGLAIAYFTDTGCQHMSYAYIYGTNVCATNGDNVSWVYSCNINDTFAPVATADASKTIFSKPASVSCYSPNNCSALNPVYYVTGYVSDVDSCPSENATFSTAYPTTANFSLGTCGYQYPYNVEQQCTDDYFVVAQFQNPNGCYGMPVYTELSVRGCVLGGNMPSDARRRSMAAVIGGGIVDSVVKRSVDSSTASPLFYHSFVCAKSASTSSFVPSSSPATLPSFGLLFVVLLLSLFVLQ